jgi:PAS domain S-box-containing protein
MIGRALLTRARVFHDQSGKAVRMLGLNMDLTAQKQLEHRTAFLLRIEDSMRALSDPDEITRTAARLLGEHLGVNRCAYADVDADEGSFNLTGDYTNGVQSIVGQYTLEQFGGELERLCREGLPYVVEDAECDPRTADVRDAYRATAIRAVISVPLRKSGKVVAGMAVHQSSPRQWRADEVDLVTQVASRCWESIERARVERELRCSEEQFRTLANSIPNLAWIAHADGHIFWYNRRWYEYTGTTEPEMEGWGWQSVHDTAILPDVMERWTRSIATGEPFEMVFPLRGADGRFRPFLTRIEPVKDTLGRVLRWFGTNTDISAQRRVEEALRTSNEELRRANRELEEFAYVASHDLQEPLRMINIYTELVTRQVRTRQHVREEYAVYISENVLRMEQLIRDLLSYSRVVHSDEPAQGTADLSVALSEALRTLGGRIDEAGAKVTVGPLPVVRGDVMQLSLVFQNLLSNALKYRRKALVPEIRISAERHGDRWVTAVADNGIGFDQQYAQRIFGLFKRLHKHEYPGTGLGLAICQRIIERYGGRIWAEGKPGAGAVFYFALPADWQG